jgi:crossover junction endonuclease EME1
MPVEVIDLVSSPECAPCRPKEKDPRPQPSAPVKAFSHDGMNRAKQALAEISSDDDNNTRPIAAKASKTFKAPAARQIAQVAEPSVKSTGPIKNRQPDPESSDSDHFDFEAHLCKGDAISMPAPTMASTTANQIPTISQPMFHNTDMSARPSTAYVQKQRMMEERMRKREADVRSLQCSDLDDVGLPAPKVVHRFATIPDSSSVATRSTSPSKDNSAFILLSDDFDSTVNLDDSILQTSSNSSFLGLDRKRMEEERLARVNGRKQAETTSSKGIVKPKQNKAPLPPRRPIAEVEDGLPPPKRRHISSPALALSKTSEYRRSISNVETSSKPDPIKPQPTGLKRSKRLLDSDPIVFTSSPDYSAEAARLRAKRKKIRGKEDDDGSDIGVGSSSKWSKEQPSQEDPFKSSDSEFPDIDTLASKPPVASFTPPVKSKAKTKTGKIPSAALDELITEKEKNTEKAKKAEEKKRKAEERGAEKARKMLAREEKIREKGEAAGIAKVNTLRINKKVSTPEMLVDLPVSLDKSSLELMGKAQGQTLADKATTFLNTLGVNVSDYESRLPIIRWRRKVEAEFNEEDGIWKPIQPHIKEEKHIMYLITAQNLVELVNGEEGHNLDVDTIRLKSKFEANEIIYLIQGLVPWMRANKNAKNRKFVEAVRSHDPQELTTAGRPKKKKAEPEHVDEDMVAEALLRLQILHGMTIHHTSSLQETAEAIRSFTQHISTIPYK